MSSVNSKRNKRLTDRLLKVLVEQGVLTPPIVALIEKDLASEPDIPVEEFLIERGLVTAEQILNAGGDEFKLRKVCRAAHQAMSETVNQSVTLSQIASAIAAKK